MTRVRNRGRLEILLLVLFLFCLPDTGCSRSPSPSIDPKSIAGKVEISPSVPLWMLHGTLTVIVYMKGRTSPSYLPVAISQFLHPVFPVHFKITQDDVRLSGIDLKGKVKLGARLLLDSGSDLVSRGEYVGMIPGEVSVGGAPVTITIDHAASNE